MVGEVLTSQANPQVAGPAVLVQTPVPVSQVSVVQTLLSLQFLAVPPQVPLVQTSFEVQALLSLHAVPLVLLVTPEPVCPAGQRPVAGMQA
jgi:hypothetical protein